MLCCLTSLASPSFYSNSPKSNNCLGTIRKGSQEKQKTSKSSPKKTLTHPVQENKTLMLRQRFCSHFLSHKTSLLHHVHLKESPYTTARPIYQIAQEKEQRGLGKVNTDLAVGLSLP